MDKGAFTYPVRCFLPHNRVLYLQIPSQTDVSSRVEGHVYSICESKEEPLECSRKVSCHLENGNVSCLEMTELGAMFSFSYSNHVAFMHEKDFRRLTFLNFNSESEYTHEIDFERLINDGHVAEGVSVRFVGVVGKENVGYGLFADRKFDCGEFIGEYVGLISPSSSNPSSDTSYTCHYPCADICYDINAKEIGNLIRFINHDSHQPNVAFRRLHFSGLTHIVCITIAEIQPHSQLKVDYGAAYWLNKHVTPAELN